MRGNAKARTQLQWLCVHACCAVLRPYTQRYVPARLPTQVRLRLEQVPVEGAPHGLLLLVGAQDACVVVELLHVIMVN